jgi:diaminobutyrate-2-oxoglutarate transaminase
MLTTTLAESNAKVNSLDVFVALESNVRTYSRTFPVIFTSARGAHMWDEDGRRYIDFLSGAGALNYGHNNPILKERMLDYLDRDGIVHSLDMATGAKRDFIEAFDRIILKPRGLSYRFQFTGPTGAHSVEAALRLARKVTNRTGLVAFTNAFHGMTQGALSVTANRYYRGGFAPDGNATFLPYEGYPNGPDALADVARRFVDPGSGFDPPAAFIVETVQGEGGVNIASARWLQDLAALARNCGSLLIVDEVQVGCGRTGSFFSFERAGIVPDMITLSKSLSGSGLPMALTLIRPELDIWQPGEHSGTFRGNNLAFVTAHAALEKYWHNEAFVDEVRRKGQHLCELLDDIVEKANAINGDRPSLTARGCGLIAGIDCREKDTAAAVVSKAFSKGLVVETCGRSDEVVKCLPPLTIGSDDLDAGIRILRAAITEVLSRS